MNITLILLCIFVLLNVLIASLKTDETFSQDCEVLQASPFGTGTIRREDTPITGGGPLVYYCINGVPAASCLTCGPPPGSRYAARRTDRPFTPADCPTINPEDVQHQQYVLEFNNTVLTNGFIDYHHKALQIRDRIPDDHEGPLQHTRIDFDRIESAISWLARSTRLDSNMVGAFNDVILSVLSLEEHAAIAPVTNVCSPSVTIRWYSNTVQVKFLCLFMTRFIEHFKTLLESIITSDTRNTLLPTLLNTVQQSGLSNHITYSERVQSILNTNFITTSNGYMHRSTS